MVTNSFEWTFPTDESISQLTLNDTDNNLLQTINLVNEEGFTNVSIDMTPYPLGMYSLLSDDQSISLFLLKEAKIPSTFSLLGLLELNLNSDIVNPTVERWQLYPKKIRWQYNLYKSVSYKDYDDQLEDISSIEDEQPLNWDHTLNVDVVEEDTRITVKSTTQVNWGDSGAHTSQFLSSNEDFFVSATIMTDLKSQLFGLSEKDNPNFKPNAMYVGIEFKRDGKLLVIEEGKKREISSTYQKDDTFCIVKVGSRVFYEKNGITLENFNTPIQEDLKPVTAFKDANAGFTDVYLHNFSSELPKLFFNRSEPPEKISYQSDRWLPYKQRPGKILELTLTDPQDESEILSIPLPNPSALELENQIDLSL